MRIPTCQHPICNRHLHLDHHGQSLFGLWFSSKENIGRLIPGSTWSTGLTTRRSEPNMTEQARSHKKSFSLQDENLRPRNPLATHFDVDSYLPVELPGDEPFVANDLSTDLATQFPSKIEEAGPSYRPNLHESQGASTRGLSTTPAVTFSEILTDRDAIRRKLVIAGDPFCGKLSLCS